MPPEFSIRAGSVDVEQIMKQIRARIREKRGVDYTEAEIRELASIKLEKFLDPTRVRSELLEHYRQGRPSPSAAPLSVPPAPPNYTFEAETAYLSSRGALGRTLYAIRRLLNPILKLFINPNPVIHVLNMQSTINRESAVRFDRFLEQWQERESRRTELDALGYEVAHNLVLEMTRLGIEVKNLKMRVESLGSRLDFTERRARALESIVQYRPGYGPDAEPAAKAEGEERRRDDRPRSEPKPEAGQTPAIAKGEAQRSRRKRRRRGRGQGQGSPAPDQGEPQADRPPSDDAAARVERAPLFQDYGSNDATPAPDPEPAAWPADPDGPGPDEP